MATPDLTSATVMDQAAALMNDAAKSVYNYTVQLPYLNMALQELQETFELNKVPVTATVTSPAIAIPANTDHVGFALTDPHLPVDLIEPQVVWIADSGQTDFISIQRLNVLPRWYEGVEISFINGYTWNAQQISFLAANADLDMKLDYVSNLFVPFTQTDGSDQVNVINAASFLEYKTASLLAIFCGENPSRGQQLAGEAVLAIDRALGIGSGGRQSITTRRRPFRNSYKRWSNV